jgi:sugar O-acyltransferase (sialic acid O-acetyltransferase NeuD family)
MEIYIIGNGGFSKEVHHLIKDSTKFRVKGFVDKSAGSSINFKEETIPVIEESYFLENIKGVNICIGTGNPKFIKNIYDKYKNYNFPNIIHRNVFYDDKNLEIGFGNIITAGCCLTTCIKIGNFNIFNLNVTVGHDSIIGDFNVFNPSSNISGNCRIGNCNMIGVGSVVLENRTIGSNSILGANSTLIGNMEDNSVYVGSPAKFKKNNT